MTEAILMGVIGQLWLWTGATVAVYSGIVTYKEWVAHAKNGQS